RVMLSLEDLPATGLIQPASRVTWRTLVAGPARSSDAAPVQAQPSSALSAVGAEAALSMYTRQAREGASSTRGVRIETLDDGRPEMRSTIERAGLFLRLVALLAALMAAVVVAMVSRDFALQRLDDCALLRVLGVSQRDMMK